MTNTNQLDPNTTDATMGQTLRLRIEQRKAEMLAVIAAPATDAKTRADLQSALGQVEPLLTGNLDRIPKVVATELSTWLEANKHLAEHHPSATLASTTVDRATNPVAEGYVAASDLSG